MSTDKVEHYDVLIVGAGLSGIAAGYHLQKSCPNKTWCILEGRASLGGTWELFRYPGIRSDSDMFTLGYSFRPWTQDRSIADGPAILKYMQETAELYGIDRRIRYGKQVIAARWSSDAARWTLAVKSTDTGAITEYTCSFFFVCAGYYDYEHGHTPQFPGQESFQGAVVHPQFWDAGLDYQGKNVVVIGSGATAVTLLPELAKVAKRVTMLQRSPTYMISMPLRDPIAHWLRELLPTEQAYALTRWKNVLFSIAFFAYCQKLPSRARKLLLHLVRQQLGTDSELLRHFEPRYGPWDQRLCLVPDGDLFEALRTGKAAVETDEILRFTERGIALKSGKELAADVIVTATGLKLKFLGGIALEVDGRKLEASELMAYKGVMLAEVPNMALAIGYTNASWTLKCELSCEFVCKLLNYMDAKGYGSCVPARQPAGMKEEPLLNLSAGYVQRAIHDFPKQGETTPWKVYQNYVLDLLTMRYKPLDDGKLSFRRA